MIHQYIKECHVLHSLLPDSPQMACSKTECALATQKSWNISDQMNSKDSLMTKSNMLVILADLGDDILHDLHKAYQGIVKSQTTVCRTIY